MAKAFVQEKKIAEIARRQVIGVFRELMADPDRGLSLRPEFARRLRRSIQSKQDGKVRDLREILARYRR